MIKKLFFAFVALIAGGCNMLWADTLDGWSKMTAMPSDPADYYFVLTAVNNPHLAVEINDDDECNIYYQSTLDPLVTAAQVWMIVPSQSGYAFQSLTHNTRFLQVDEKNTGIFIDNQLSDPELTYFAIEASDGTFAIKNNSREGSYWSTSESVAAGVSILSQGTTTSRFDIYAMSRANYVSRAKAKYLNKWNKITAIPTDDYDNAVDYNFVITQADAPTIMMGVNGEDAWLKDATDPMFDSEKVWRIQYDKQKKVFRLQNYYHDYEFLRWYHPSECYMSSVYDETMTAYDLVYDGVNWKIKQMTGDSYCYLGHRGPTGENNFRIAGNKTEDQSLSEAEILHFDIYAMKKSSYKSVAANMYISDVHYATFFAPFNVTVPSGVTAYVVNSCDEEKLFLTPLANTIPANTAVILQSDKVHSYNFVGSATSTASPHTNNKLVGTLTAQEVPVGSFVMQDLDDTGLGFYIVDSSITIGANRAYLSLGSNNVRTFFLLGGGSTSIAPARAERQGHDYYDLAGRRLHVAPQKGLYIYNGKKIIK